MTDCRRQLTFSFYQHKQLVADFKGGQISSDTGLLAVRELDQKLGWLAAAASLISDTRREDRTELGILPFFANASSDSSPDTRTRTTTSGCAQIPC